MLTLRGLGFSSFVIAGTIRCRGVQNSYSGPPWDSDFRNSGYLAVAELSDVVIQRLHGRHLVLAFGLAALVSYLNSIPFRQLLQVRQGHQHPQSSAAVDPAPDLPYQTSQHPHPACASLGGCSTSSSIA